MVDRSMLIGDFLGWVVVEKFEVFRFEFGVSGSIDPGGDRFSRGEASLLSETLREREASPTPTGGRRGSTHPALSGTPVLSFFYSGGTPE
jgi:hypothetical protein